ncbi:class I SAM-dependent methyltransferase [Candidatus Woesearchaeota archaeon]|nr:class I SAM-dependent methyltransferase [Candidatus Woesearchaeota archaeon]
MKETLKDVYLIIKSLQRSAVKNGGRFYWDVANSDNLANLVNRLSNPNNRERQVIRELLQREHPFTLLDAGCGVATELSSYRIGNIKVNYVGLDKSSYMIAKAKKGYPGAKFVRGEVESLPFPDDSFDVVVLRHVLEHLENYKTAVKEALRVSREIIIIDFFHRLLPFGLSWKIWDKDGYWNNWYSKTEFVRFLQSLNISYKVTTTKGNSGQTAEIYILEKRV